MSQLEEDVRKRLFALQDVQYQEFASRLTPTIDKDTVIGVRTPALRALSREFARLPAPAPGALTPAAAFLRILPHRYYEENNLHAFLIEQIKDCDACLAALDAFLPYVDNWATCDMMRPKVFKKHPIELPEAIRRWMASGQTYAVRFGIEMLMSFYLDDHFRIEYAGAVAGVRSEEYYINMMIAWYFATALAKQYDAVLPFLEQHRLDTWTHNKAIQKAIESYRITDEQKAYLRTLKVK